MLTVHAVAPSKTATLIASLDLPAKPLEHKYGISAMAEHLGAQLVIVEEKILFYHERVHDDRSGVELPDMSFECLLGGDAKRKEGCMYFTRTGLMN